jgi:NADH:ubiquinone oxidoreductase subunit 2 (subunit N)
VSPTDEPAVSEAPVRGPFERQLNVGLMVVLVLMALVVVYGVVYVAHGWDGNGPHDRFTTLQIGVVFLVIPGTVVFFVARSARKRLKAQVVSARLFAILTGIFTVFAGLPIVSTVIGLLSIVAGLFTLTAALLMKRERLQ